jgi:hypothetical protein
VSSSGSLSLLVFGYAVSKDLGTAGGLPYCHTQPSDGSARLWLIGSCHTLWVMTQRGRILEYFPVDVLG